MLSKLVIVFGISLAALATAVTVMVDSPRSLPVTAMGLVSAAFGYSKVKSQTLENADREPVTTPLLGAARS